MPLRFSPSLPGFLLLQLVSPSPDFAATLQKKTLVGWERYVRLTEQRIERELQQPMPDRPGATVEITRMRTTDENGNRVTAEAGMIHHWKGVIFVPGVSLDTVLKFVQDYDLSLIHISEPTRPY